MYTLYMSLHFEDILIDDRYVYIVHVFTFEDILIDDRYVYIVHVFTFEDILMYRRSICIHCTCLYI